MEYQFKKKVRVMTISDQFPKAKPYLLNNVVQQFSFDQLTALGEANNLRPTKIEKRGKKFYSLKDKELVVSHYTKGKGKEDKEKFTNHKAERHDEVVELLREQVQQLKQANEQLVHDNDILTDQVNHHVL